MQLGFARFDHHDGRVEIHVAHVGFGPIETICGAEGRWEAPLPVQTDHRVGGIGGTTCHRCEELAPTLNMAVYRRELPPVTEIAAMMRVLCHSDQVAEAHARTMWNNQFERLWDPRVLFDYTSILR